MRFEIQLTGLHRAHETAIVYGAFFQYSEAEVTIPLNDARTARVRLSMHDPLVTQVIAFSRMLKIRYYDSLIFWGVITEPEFDLSTESVLITAADQSARLKANYARLGDPAERHSTDNGFAGNIPVDYRGMRMLVDCARNFAQQDDRDDPTLGISNGLANTEVTQHIAVERGSEVWATMQDMSAHIPGPDFELAPTTSGWPNYTTLNCYDKQGSDKSRDVVFHAGFGRGNLEDMTWTPGGRVVTHAHVLDSEGKFRRTSVSVPAANSYGTYVYWDATQYKVTSKDDLDVLSAKGAEIIDAYSRPPDYHTIKPILDSGYVFGRDYGIGDYITSAIKCGYVSHEMVGRVIEVSLGQEEQTDMVRENITVVPDVSNSTDIG